MAANAKDATAIAQANAHKDSAVDLPNGPAARMQPSVAQRRQHVPEHIKVKTDTIKRIKAVPSLASKDLENLENRRKWDNLRRECHNSQVTLPPRGRLIFGNNIDALRRDFNNANAPPHALDKNNNAAADRASPTGPKEPITIPAFTNETRKRTTWAGSVTQRVQEILEANGFFPGPTLIDTLTDALASRDLLLNRPRDIVENFCVKILAIDAAFIAKQQSKELAGKRPNLKYTNVFLPTVLWLASSKKLAAQIHDELEMLSAGLDIDVQCCCGGYDYPKYATNQSQISIMIGTVGRLWEMIWAMRNLRLDNTELFIMDDARGVHDPSLLQDGKALAIIKAVALSNSLRRGNCATRAIIATTSRIGCWPYLLEKYLILPLQRKALFGAFWHKGTESIVTTNVFVDVHDAKFANPHFQHPHRGDKKVIALCETLSNLTETSRNQLEGKCGRYLVVEATRAAADMLEFGLVFRAKHASSLGNPSPTPQVFSRRAKLDQLSNACADCLCLVTTPGAIKRINPEYPTTIMIMNAGGQGEVMLQRWQAIFTQTGGAARPGTYYTFIDTKSDRGMEFVKLLIPWLQARNLEVPEFVFAAVEAQEAEDAKAALEGPGKPLYLR